MTDKYIQKTYGYTREDLLSAAGKLGLGIDASVELTDPKLASYDVGLRLGNSALFSSFDFDTWVLNCSYPTGITQPARIHRIFLSQINSITRSAANGYFSRGEKWVGEFQIIRILKNEHLTEREMSILTENGFIEVKGKLEFDLRLDSVSRKVIRDHNLKLFSK